MTKQSILRHSERSEESKSREAKTNNKSMTQKRIGESHKFSQSKQITNNSKVAKMDSSLHGLRRFAQNDESYGLPRLAFASLAMTNRTFRLCEAHKAQRSNSLFLVFARHTKHNEAIRFFSSLRGDLSPKQTKKQ